MESTIEKIVSLALKASKGYSPDDRYTVLNEAGYRLQEEASNIIVIEGMDYNEMENE